jgi:DNA recombination protein RmuC
MNVIQIAVAFVIGGTLGALAVALWSRARLTTLQVELARLKTTLDHERSAAEERVRLIQQTQDQLKESFRTLSTDALDSNRASFLDLARETLARQQIEARGELEKREQAVKSLVEPIGSSLEKVRQHIEQVEKKRATDYGGLTAQLRAFSEDQTRLRIETGNLVKALRRPTVRGRWGEIQLRRVVEMAGMVKHCDFTEQTTAGDESSRSRPDLVVRLPGNKQVVVDAKTPLDAYLDALEAEGETARDVALARHAQQVRDHIAGLSKRSYWDQFDSSPEFVVMFLPNEGVFHAALEQDATLIEKGVEQKVILATPTTLIALLRAVHYGWQQEVLAENAQRISELGRELYERLATLAGHFRDLGARLDSAIDSYNKAVGSLEARVLVSARKFPELGISRGKQLPELTTVDRTARGLQADELASGEDDGEPQGGEQS